VNKMIKTVAGEVSARLGRDSRVINAARPVYERLLNALTFGRGIPWSINGIPCYIDARCRGAMSEVYDPEGIDFMRQAIRQGSVCYDVGANLGVYAIQFSNMVGPTGKVVAFEPNPHALRMLRHHVAINNLSNVRIVAAAAAEAPGTADFYAANWNGMGRLGAANSGLKETERFTVPVTTVDEQVAQTGLVPDFILIDVEGFEIVVLEGARNTVLRHRPTVVVEMHPDVWASASTDRKRAESLLRDLGLRAESFLPGRDPLADHCLSVLRPV
jgi:FkbM family methyltransferase